MKKIELRKVGEQKKLIFLDSKLELSLKFRETPELFDR